MKSRIKKMSKRSYTMVSLVLVIVMMFVTFNLMNNAHADGDKSKDIKALIKSQQSQIDELKKEIDQLKKDQEVTQSFMGDLITDLAALEEQYDDHVKKFEKHLKDHQDLLKYK